MAERKYRLGDCTLLIHFDASEASGAMMTTPRRRWFRFAFSLRTLFIVVTIFGVWLGWNLKIVRERRAAMQDAKECFGSNDTFFMTVDDASGIVDLGYAQVSNVRLALGDEGILSFALPVSFSSKLIERIEYAFPESRIIVFELPSGEWIATRDSLYASERELNTGTIFKTGLIEK